MVFVSDEKRKISKEKIEVWDFFDFCLLNL